MKVSINWLKDYSEIDIDTKELAHVMSMTGSKVEGIEEKGNDIKNVVVGKILEIEKHPNADKLVVTKVDIGDEIVQIVTGATNIKVGDIVPVAKNGSELPNNVKITKGLLRGIESNGMMCSVPELALKIEDYPGQIEDGIMILNKEYEKYISKDIVEVLDLKKEVIEFEITPNRPDCLSVEGLGREVAASLNKKFINPHKNLDEMKLEKVNEIEGLKVDISAPDLCYRYVARVVKNVKIEQSPEWLRKRLSESGVRAINNIVDITNYVMLEMGQPMHAFDINSIEGKHITVRRATENEKIQTLDEEQRILDENMLVIADTKKPVAIAGVMGGMNSEIEDNTKTVVFESAVFNGASIRKTSKKLGLRTEASSRYEKGLSPENALRAVNRAVELVKQLNAGEVIDKIIDVYPEKQKTIKIEFYPERINNLLGTSISEQEMIEILSRLDIKVENGIAIPPYFRQDIEQEADLAEEVLRIYGYDKLESTLVNNCTTLGGRNKYQKLEYDLRNIMCDSGFSEIYCYSFINENDLTKININEQNNLSKYAIYLKKPLSEEYTIMRTSTIPSMMGVIATNYAKKNEDVKLFEIGKTYINSEQQIENNKLPQENNILTFAMYGKDVDFYILKGYVENIFEKANIKRYDIDREKENQSYHPGRVARLRLGNDVIAVFGEIHPNVLENYGVSDRVYLAEINIDKLVKYSRAEKKYTSIAKYPAIIRDIAIIVDEKIEAATIERIIQRRAKKMLEEQKLFDVYRSEKLGENKKSMAYSLKFRSNEKTLTDEEINATMDNIILDLKKEAKAELRSH